MFGIYTISNDLSQYSAMRESFAAAGFDAGRCTYHLLDNSNGNVFDPYLVLSSLNENRTAEYVVLCHQDVRIDRGHGYETLVERVTNLTATDPRWAVAGNFGCTAEGTSVGRVNDPHQTNAPGKLPQQVISLDENFLLLRPSSTLRCTPGLRGFHLYGTDICLNAYMCGHSCYVIDFELTHLSGGVITSRDFTSCLTRFCDAWNPRLSIASVRTSTVLLRLSRWAMIRVMLRSSDIRRVIQYLGLNLRTYPGWSHIAS